MMRQSSVISNAPGISHLCTMMVSSVGGTVSKALSLGGKIALPKMPVPGMGWRAYVKDTEGNIFGRMEAHEKAA